MGVWTQYAEVVGPSRWIIGDTRGGFNSIVEAVLKVGISNPQLGSWNKGEGEVVNNWIDSLLFGVDKNGLNM